MVEQGRAVEAAIDDANETMDSVFNIALDLVLDKFPEGRTAIVQCHICYISIDLCERDF